MPNSWTLTVAPSEEPLTVADLKAHSRIDIADEDSLIALYITAARQQFEHEWRGVLITQTWTLYCDRFPLWFQLPKPPLQTVNFIKYLDENGAEQTLASSQYVVDAHSTPARIARAENVTWPTTQPVLNAVWVEYVAGFGTAAAVPEIYKQAIRWMAAAMYQQREGSTPQALTQLPMGVDAIINSNRVWL